MQYFRAAATAEPQPVPRQALSPGDPTNLKELLQLRTVWQMVACTDILSEDDVCVAVTSLRATCRMGIPCALTLVRIYTGELPHG